MTINQLLEEEARKRGYDESEIERAASLADAIAAPGRKGRELLAMDLPDELVAELRAYTIYLLDNMDKPDMRKYVSGKVNKMIENN